MYAAIYMQDYIASIDYHETEFLRPSCRRFFLKKNCRSSALSFKIEEEVQEYIDDIT
jgi:hypothetical protein